jgi:uncharacterized protein YecE (DUF72 family)
MQCSPNILCGPSGWAHPHWNSVVYPQPKPRGFHCLEHLAGLFPSVEISSSFQQIPKPELTRLWMRKVAENPQFRFTAKLHRRFTHDRILDAAEVLAFKEAFLPMQKAKKLGCILMQFPWSFRFTAENREFLIKLRRTFHEFQLVAEMRHSSWMLDEALGTLIDYRVGFCNIDQPAYTKAMPATSFLTSGIGYVRLHGRNCFNWYSDSGDPARMHRYDYLYSESELEEWKNRIDRIGRCAEATFVVFNNDAAGKAVVNALQMKAMLSGQTARQMDLLKKYPARIAQSSLFTEYNAKAVA